MGPGVSTANRSLARRIVGRARRSTPAGWLRHLRNWSRSADDELSLGLAAYGAGDLGRAIDLLERAVRKNRSPDFVDTFLGISAGVGEVDAPLRAIDPAAGRAACERLFARNDNWNAQVTLVIYCVRAGLWDLANTNIERLIRTCTDTIVIWRLSDVLLGLGRNPDADRIYRILSAQAPDDPAKALYCGLAFERLQEPERAADCLEDAMLRYPDAPYLREHLLRVCMANGLIDRLVRLDDGSPEDAGSIEALFDQYTDGLPRTRLVDFCLDKGHVGLVLRQLQRTDQPPYDSETIWRIAASMEARGFPAEAGDLRQMLMGRPHHTWLDAYFAALSATTHTGDVGLGLSILEAGQRRHPEAADLDRLYLVLCADHLQYERYAAFKNTVSGSNSKKSIDDLYKSAIDYGSTLTFILNFHEITLISTPNEIDNIKSHLIHALGNTTSAAARLIAFFSTYLDVGPQFVAALRETSMAALARQEGTTAERLKEHRTIDILFRMTPPMVQGETRTHGFDSRAFIDAATSLAASPIELVEPLRDMAESWTPWQCLFCSGWAGDYAEAIAALERVAFQSWPKLNYTASHLTSGARATSGRARIRIGFIVHDSMPMMSGLLAGLDSNVFETVFLHPGAKGDTRASRNWHLRAERVVSFSDKDAFEGMERIAAEALDIIVSGPSMAAIFFPMLGRLAHLQIVLLEPNWTDGTSNNDYYVSWQDAEPKRPEEFYRTKVAYLKHPPYYIERPTLGAVSEEEKAEVRRRLLGDRASGTVYLCASTPPKIRPEMDGMFRDLLERDPQGTLVLLRGDYPPAKTLKARLSKALGPHKDRVVFLPSLKQEEAHRLLHAADACMDSFPLCGMSSSFDAAMLGVPTVTLPSDIPFGRWTAAMYDYIGVEGLTATDQEDYLRIALRLAREPEWRNAIGAEIKERAEVFVESAASSAEFAAFVARAWERHAAGEPPAHWIDGQWRTAESA